MSNKPKTPTKSVHILFDEQQYNQLKEYADIQEKPLSIIIKGAVRSLVESGFNKINPNEVILINRLNTLEEEVINLRNSLEELQKEVKETNNYVYLR